MDSTVKNHKIIIEDISKGAENAPIPVVNDVNGDIPKNFCYMMKNKFTAKVLSLVGHHQEKKGCQCNDVCEPETCPCEIQSSVVFNPQERLVAMPKMYHMYTDKYVECGQHCGCRAKCKRRILNGYVAKRLILKHTGERGFGLVADQPIALGMPVCEYIGEVRHSAEQNSQSIYQYTVFRYNKDRQSIIIDSHEFGNIARFLNHSCFPNTAGIRVYNAIPKGNLCPLPRIILIALRNILPGEELTVDYGSNYFYYFKVSCKCYSPVCYVPPEDYDRKKQNKNEIFKNIKNSEKFIRKNWDFTKDIQPPIIDLDSDD